ncbi:MAG: cellobiose phosphorylase [Vallitaleaceae bacterium]|nr:cellobiose phosphorylase [Vallitaleaceae bacterium]
MKKQPNYALDSKGEFVIENYNAAKPFSSFLPAIAGLYGKPMWVYYVNKGQCLSSMGINNKDCAITEFLPANKAYRQTSLQGFRTFLKVTAPDEEAVYYEPFQDNLFNKQYDLDQSMHITSHDLRLKDINHTLGVVTEVTFCTLPGEFFSGLIRVVKIENISGKNLEIEVLDGLPVILPYFLSNDDIKNMSNLRQAWMGVENYNTIPFYKISVLPNDSPETSFIEGGNFYANFDFQSGRPQFSKVVVEPALVFGNITDLSYPEKFMEEEFSVPTEQVSVGVTPCGFGHKKLNIPAGNHSTVYTLIGNIEKYEKLQDFMYNTLSEDYMNNKMDENKNVIEQLKQFIFTSSSSTEFDMYCGQSMVDNVLRGGYPVKVGNGKHNYYVYSRKHGDLEREYNFFQVDATYFSQGNSNFRDVNQNRRNDVSFFPFIKDTNVRTFFDLIQLDGFNPLVLKGSKFSVENENKLEVLLQKHVEAGSQNVLREYLKKPFAPGELLRYMEVQGIQVHGCSLDAFFNAIVENTSKEDIADFSEGYWVDHWIYNNDLLEQFLSIYPDQMTELLFDNREYTYYESNEVVVPRSQKYVLTKQGVRQYGAVVKSLEKDQIMKQRVQNKNKAHTNYGLGEVYKTSLMGKIICLMVNKVASLDPNGTGIEMESNKPGWCDALNGMPGILGSSINESVELKRLGAIVLDFLNTSEGLKDKKILVPEEIFDFFNQMYPMLSAKMPVFDFWEKSYSLKEQYRSKTQFGISGIEVAIGVEQFKQFAQKVIDKVDAGLENAFNEVDGLHYTYFINEVTNHIPVLDAFGHETLNENGLPYVESMAFKQRPIAYFLEGPVHVLRVEKDTQRAQNMYQSIKKTGLYDEKLEMYKVNDNIMNETKEIGRQNIFPRGWLENEAVFLHMEYKYFFELLRTGLYDEYMKYFKNALVPFLKPEVYGRSILENSSFIASTVHPDPKTHGTGYVSRLTGASAEFLSMWLYMTAGRKPFLLDSKGALTLELKPILPGWLFTEKVKEVTICDATNTWQTIKLEENTFAFNFLGNLLTVYHNKSRKNTYGEDAVMVKRIELLKNGEVISILGDKIPAPYAKMVREGQIDQMDLYLE